MANTISTKTAATGAVGGASGIGLAPLIIWALGQFGIDMPPEVAAVAGGIIAGLASTLIAWLVPAKSGKYVDAEPWEGEVTEEPADPVIDAGIDDDPDIVDPDEFDLAEVV
ncbi:MAG: hypothetical protein ACTH2U_11130 [Brevibacterium sp.]